MLSGAGSYPRLFAFYTGLIRMASEQSSKEFPAQDSDYKGRTEVYDF